MLRYLLRYYKPDKATTPYGIKLLAPDLSTFKSYERCLETGVVVQDNTDTDGTASGEDNDETIYDNITYYSKLNFLAHSLRDVEIANKIMNTLIAYFNKTKTVFSDDQIGMIDHFFSDIPGDGGRMFSGLWRLALQTRIFTASLERGWRILDSRSSTIKPTMFFTQDRLRRYGAYGLGGDMEARTRDYPFATGAKELSDCYDQDYLRRVF